MLSYQSMLGQEPKTRYRLLIQQFLLGHREASFEEPAGSYQPLAYDQFRLGNLLRQNQHQ